MKKLLKSMTACALALIFCLSGCSGGSKQPKQASEGSRVVTRVGIDFQTADQNALVNSGMVSGKFQGNTTTSYLSFSTTINGFQEDGMTCVVTPVYKAAE